MSAPLRLNADELERLARFLLGVTGSAVTNGVRLGAYGPLTIAIDGVPIDIGWDDEIGQYVINDRIGS